MTSSYAQTFRPLFTLLVLMSCFTLFQSHLQAAKGKANGKIAFETSRDGNNEIYAMNANGTNQVNLSNNPSTDSNVAWSPDGTRIAFNSNRDAFFQEIYVMNADGSNQTRLTFNTTTDNRPQWFPDGSKIVFSSNRDGNFEIYVMNADGSGQTRLTNNAASDLHPSWSPDGTKIVFDSDRDGNREIYVMNADGTGQTRLTISASLDQVASFSPDGTKILFQHHVDDDAQIFIMNANGSNLVQLTTQGSNNSPVFSPDGTKIAFNSDRDGNDEIYVMNAEGSSEQRLTNNSAFDRNPNWQPVHHTDTIGVFRPSTSQFLLRNSNTAGAPDITIAFGQPGDLPVSGDWNGDGKTDVGVFRNGQFLLRQTITINVLGHPQTFAITTTINFGLAGDLPVTGDWDGDGIDTPGVFRPSTGQWFLTNGPNTNNTSPPAAFIFSFGLAGDVVVAGDFDGDGKDGVGVFRPSTGQFFLDDTNTSNAASFIFSFGTAGDLAVGGDWNGDGADGVAVFRPSIAQLFLDDFNTTNGLTGQFAFGQAGDIPLSGDWDGKP